MLKMLTKMLVHKKFHLFVNILSLDVVLTEAAEVKINIELRSSGSLRSGYSLRNDPEECSYLLHGGSLNSHKDRLSFLILKTL